MQRTSFPSMLRGSLAIFLRSGVDNVLNHTAFTLGGGIRWRDDDLKYLLGSIPLGK